MLEKIMTLILALETLYHLFLWINRINNRNNGWAVSVGQVITDYGKSIIWWTLKATVVIYGVNQIWKEDINKHPLISIAIIFLVLVFFYCLVRMLDRERKMGIYRL